MADPVIFAESGNRGFVESLHHQRNFFKTSRSWNLFLYGLDNDNYGQALTPGEPMITGTQDKLGDRFYNNRYAGFVKITDVAVYDAIFGADILADLAWYDSHGEASGSAGYLPDASGAAWDWFWGLNGPFGDFVPSSLILKLLDSNKMRPGTYHCSCGVSNGTLDSIDGLGSGHYNPDPDGKSYVYGIVDAVTQIFHPIITYSNRPFTVVSIPTGVSYLETGAQRNPLNPATDNNYPFMAGTPLASFGDYYAAFNSSLVMGNNHPFYPAVTMPMGQFPLDGIGGSSSAFAGFKV